VDVQDIVWAVLRDYATKVRGVFKGIVVIQAGQYADSSLPEVFCKRFLLIGANQNMMFKAIAIKLLHHLIEPHLYSTAQ
jgi:hypothetical protein